MPDGEHQFVNITLAGARSPRAASKQGETSEPLGDDVSRYGSLPPGR
jgi:staphylococcal nuclease domain-containing protein 1